MKARFGAVFVILCLILAANASSSVAQDLFNADDSSQIPPEAAQLDLNDPKVRERLRAAGIDPDDLESLMRARRALKPATNAAPPTKNLFPPVSEPPETAQPDTLESDVSEDVTKPKYFGYDIFNRATNTFEPLAFGPVSQDYIVGPGDEVIVTVWGAQELNAKVEVNREGYILLPDLGQVLVNGYTLSGLKNHLEKRLSRIYSGIRSDGRGATFVDVSLGKLRSLQVFVLGDVSQPGAYTISATSTVMNALYYAGGPTLQGSMRTIRVLRNNEIVQRVDLYEYLAKGDRSHDVKLQSGDVVFVPPVGKRIDLTGEVHHVAKYELRNEESLQDLLKMAGGLTATADLTRAQVERIIPFSQRDPLSQEDRKVLDVALVGGGAADTNLHDGDIVRIFRVGNVLKNTVKILGSAVHRPGVFEHQPGLHVSDLIQKAGGLLGDAYMGWAHLVRTHPDRTRQLISFSLEGALASNPADNLALKQEDEVQVFSIWDIRDTPNVSIEGLVRKPGQYELLEGMTITDLIVRAGGLKEEAYRVHSEVSRINPEAVSSGHTAELIKVSMQGTPSDADAFVLQKNDIVFVRKIPNWSLQDNVKLTGEVRFPGTYSLTSRSERLSSIVDRAGGLNDTAYLRGAIFIRNEDDTGRMAIDFEEALKKRKKGNNKYDLVMVAGDSVHIPLEPTTVKVRGAVGFPSSVLWEKGRDAGYYLEQAGGLLDNADKDKIRVIMANGRVRKPGWLGSPEPDAGAEIVVPTKPEKKEGNSLKNFAQIISILTGAATTIYLISQTSK